MKQNNPNKLSKVLDKVRNFWTKINQTVPFKKMDLTVGMIRVIIVCWLLPYLALSVVLFYWSETKTNSQIEDTVTTSMENAAVISKTSILEAVEESKKASYDGVIKNSYVEYLKTKDESKMYMTISSYLNKTYKYSTSVSNTILLFNRQTAMEYYTYSNVAGATYESINEFKRNSIFTIKKAASKLGTGSEFVLASGHLYLVRNLVTSDYKPFAILVMEINTDNIFKSMDNVVWRQDGMVYLENNVIKDLENMTKEEKEYLLKYATSNVILDTRITDEEMVTKYDSSATVATLTMKANGQLFSFVVKLDKVGIMNEKSPMIYMYVIIVILLIPLLFATIYYFYSNISNPISQLMFASEKIEDGDFGYRIKEFNKNEEFGKLVDTFNHMSVSLQESFNRIYAEEIAVRDANMKALQAQINPHFLNNTLEIINWKARMSGNDDVSGMIESLGIMMEATMNRNNESFITIREEMKYVDAYLYIIDQRFGSKFNFTKEIDEKLLNLKIPRLIIQPLVENMVEHGGDIYGNRTGKLKIYENPRYLHIVVENNGNIGEADKKKIEDLLNARSMEENARNIGIRNVNIRLKMLYGEQSGLIVSNPKKDLTVSEIIIEKRKLL